MRIEMMRADAKLRDAQAGAEMWKVAAAMGGVIVAAIGAGAGLVAGPLTYFKWHYGVG